MLQHGCFTGITIGRTDLIFIGAVTSMCFIVVREAKNHFEPGRADSIKIVLNKLQKCGIYSCCFETLQHVCAVYKGTMKVIGGTLCLLRFTLEFHQGILV